MAAPSSSTSVPFCSAASLASCGLIKPEVFLDFRGEDTRKGFTTHLYDKLQGEGIPTFMDEKKINLGEKIDETIMKAMKESRYCVAVISRGYADSTWCLIELAAMYKHKKAIIPVFYHVDPSDVRRQTGPFKGAFGSHEERFCAADVKNWKEAMAYVAGLRGSVISHDE